ncbi:Isoaspartyl peptidase/L-asparaginase [Balamuthia mandrillaris]
MADSNGNRPQKEKRPEWVLVIHGGAGAIHRAQMTPEQRALYLAGLQRALDAGAAILSSTPLGSSLDAVVAAVKVMEDDPMFNAGKGSVLTADRTFELDASIMEGRTLRAGAVSCVSNVKNPVVLARRVMERTPHVMLVGGGAERFAKEQEDEELVLLDDPFEREQQLDRLLEKQHRQEEEQERENKGTTTTATLTALSEDLLVKNEKTSAMPPSLGTVGAVALDREGNLAAATSTGGMTNKRAGRVGDSPIIGAGTYANNRTCAVSATGHGEWFMRTVVAHELSARMQHGGEGLEAAAEELVMRDLKEAGGEGGLVAVDSEGRWTWPFNSMGMFRGVITSEGERKVAIYEEEESREESEIVDKYKQKE